MPPDPAAAAMCVCVCVCVCVQWRWAYEFVRHSATFVRQRPSYSVDVERQQAFGRVADWLPSNAHSRDPPCSRVLSRAGTLPSLEKMFLLQAVSLENNRFTGPVHTLVRALARSHPSLRVIYLLLLPPLRPTNAQSKLNWIRYAGVWPHVQAVCVTVWP